MKFNLREKNHYLLPFVFNFSGIINLLLFHFGLLSLKSDGLRGDIFIIFGVIYFFIILFLFLKDLLKKKINIKSTINIFIIILLYLISFIYGFISFGINSFVLDYFLKFVVFLVPAYILGYYFARYGDIKKFFVINEKINLIILIPMIYYLITRIVSDNQWIRDLGSFNYMSMAYAILPLLLSSTILLLDGKEKLFKLDLKKSTIVRYIIIIISWITIISTGTRGCIIGVLLFNVLIFIYSLIKKHNIKNMLFNFTSILGILLFLLFIYAPKGFAIDRSIEFLNNLFIGKFQTSSEILDNKEENNNIDSNKDPIMDDENNSDNTKEEINNNINSDKAPIVDDKNNLDNNKVENNNTNSDKAPIVDDKNSLDNNKVENNNINSNENNNSLNDADNGKEDNNNILDDLINTDKNSGVVLDRSYLFKLALIESIRKPLFGLKPFGFSYKYNNYPHNAFFEILSEFGIIIGGCFCLLYAWLVLKKTILLFKYSNKYYDFMFIFFLFTFLFQCMVSSSIWINSFFIFSISYYINYVVNVDCKKENKSKNKNKFFG